MGRVVADTCRVCELTCQSSPAHQSSSLILSALPNATASSHPSSLLSIIPSSRSAGDVRCSRCRFTRFET